MCCAVLCLNEETPKQIQNYIGQVMEAFELQQHRAQQKPINLLACINTAMPAPLPKEEKQFCPSSTH